MIMIRKTNFGILGFLFIVTLVKSQVPDAGFYEITSEYTHKEITSLVKNARIAALEDSINKRKSEYSREDWQVLIDEYWGAGIPTAQKLAIFDDYWKRIDEGYSGFPNSDVDWDSIRSKYRPEIEAGVSRGRFHAIIGKMVLDLQELHADILNDTFVGNYELKPGTPLLALTDVHDHFGARMTPLPDSSLLVYRVVPDHALGLEPGDRILGYENRPWKDLLRQLISCELPLSTPVKSASTTEASWHIWLNAVGNNWHLFDTIDIVKYNTTDTLHMPTSLIQDRSASIFGIDQMAVPGISFPDLMNNDYISWGIVEGTSIGYIYTFGHIKDADASELITAIQELSKNSEGLIIDSRLNDGGNVSPAEAITPLFNETRYTFGTDKRTDPYDHFGFTTVTAGNLPYASWPAWSENEKIYGKPPIYDRPIAILTGPYSGSYGDIFPAMVKMHPYARTFGKPTMGGFSPLDGNGIFDLMDGWLGRHPNYADYLYDDPHNYLVHTSPSPDESIWLTPDAVVAGYDNVVNRAVEWIRNKVYPHDAFLKPFNAPGSEIQPAVYLQNPNNHNVSLSAYLYNYTTRELIDSTIMVVADSNRFAGNMDIPDIEENFALTFISRDLEGGDNQELPMVCRFTTRGPVIIDHYEITSVDNIPNPGDRIRYSLYFKNEGSYADISDLRIQHNAIDTFVISRGLEGSIESLSPGETVVNNHSISIDISEDCPVPSTQAVQIDIYEGDILYWIDTLLVDVYDPTGIKEIAGSASLRLYQNYPNPFREKTSLTYVAPPGSRVNIMVYDMVGKVVGVITSNEIVTGTRNLTWDATDFPDGIYFCTIYVETAHGQKSGSRTIKMVKGE